MAEDVNFATEAKDIVKYSQQLKAAEATLGPFTKSKIKLKAAVQGSFPMVAVSRIKSFGQGLHGLTKGLGLLIPRYKKMGKTLDVQKDKQAEYNKELENAEDWQERLWIRLDKTVATVKSMATSFLSLFSIFLTVVIGLAMLSVAFNGTNSPLVEMSDGITGLEQAMDGLVLIISGEGEGGFSGAINIAAAALAVTAVAFIAFGAPIALFVGAITLGVGAFRLIKNATNDTKTAILGALAVVIAAAVPFVALVSGAALGAVAAVMLPIALFVAGLAALWAAFTGKAPVWVGIVGAVAVAAATVIILGVGLIPLAIIAIVLVLALLIKRNWSHIKKGLAFVASFIPDWVKKLGTGAIKLLKGAWDALLALGKFVISMVFGGIIGFGALILGTIGGLILGILGIPVKLWKSFWTKVIRGKGGIIAFVKGIPADIKDGFVSGFKKAFNAITGIYNKFARLMAFDIPDWVPIVGGKEFKLPEIPALAKGGIVTKPTMALIGEAGPEAVVPLKKGGAGMGTINVNIDVSGVTDRSDKRALAREISDILQQELKRINGASSRGRF